MNQRTRKIVLGLGIACIGVAGVSSAVSAKVGPFRDAPRPSLSTTVTSIEDRTLPATDSSVVTVPSSPAPAVTAARPADDKGGARVGSDDVSTSAATTPAGPATSIDDKGGTRTGSDDPAGHDVGDDKGGSRVGSDDPAGHDAGDDKGGTRTTTAPAAGTPQPTNATTAVTVDDNGGRNRGGNSGHGGQDDGANHG